MAATILASHPHPLSSIPLEDDLSIVFELENPFQMPMDRIRELAIACARDFPLAAAYLCGVYETRAIDSLCDPR